MDIVQSTISNVRQALEDNKVDVRYIGVETDEDLVCFALMLIIKNLGSISADVFDAKERNKVDLHVIGYEWTCGNCGQYNKVEQSEKFVTCETCELTFVVKNFEEE